MGVLLLRRHRWLLRPAVATASGVAAAALIVGVALAVTYGSDKRGTAAGGRAAAAGCRVSRPTTHGPPGQGAERVWVGGPGIWTYIDEKATVVAARNPAQQPAGTLVGQAQPGGAVYAKFPWWRYRETTAPLVIGGSRQPKTSKPLRADLPRRAGASVFFASSLTFPEPGCWTVTARWGVARLVFVVRVVNNAVP